MKKAFRWAVLLGLCKVFSVASMAQQGIEAVAADLIRNIRSEVRENILIQTDKSVYAATDRVWFKIFLLDSVSDKLKAVEGMLFVDIVDQRDRPVAQLFQHTSHRESGGCVSLPPATPTGLYFLRAYTRFDPATQSSNMAVRPLLILNGQFPAAGGAGNFRPPVSHPGSSGTRVARIFPEGGHLMAGEQNLVGIRLADANGQPVSDSVIVRDRMGKVILRFMTNPAGLARFRFSPTARGKYDLLAKNGDRFDSITAMPIVNPSSAQVSIAEQNGQSLKVKVMLEDSLFNEHFTTYLLGLNKDSLCFASVGQGMYYANVPVNAFPAGISSLLLFNDRGNLLSRRDLYLGSQRPRITMRPSKDHVGPREKVDLDLQITDAEGKPLLATYTLSVADQRLAEQNSPFFQDFLAGDSAEDVDLMLLTGYAVRGNADPPRPLLPGTGQPAFDPFTFEGGLHDPDGRPLPHYQLSMISLGQRPLVLQDTTRSDGHFAFRLPPFPDSLQVEFKAKPLKGPEKDYFVRAQTKQFPVPPTPAAKKIAWAGNWQDYEEKVKKYQYDTLFVRSATTLPPVTVSEKMKSKEAATAGKNNVITKDQLQVQGIDNIANLVLMVQGVHLRNGYLVMGGLNDFYPSATDEPIVVTDGSQVDLAASGDAENSSPVLAYLRTLNAREIESIRVLNSMDAASYGVRGGHGVIEITTADSIYQPGVVRESKKFWIEGFRTPRPFVARDYSSGESLADKKPDYRTTLYWDGDLVTDARGANRVSFYTGDANTDYLITLSGITAKGERLYKTVILHRQ